MRAPGLIAIAVAASASLLPLAGRSADAPPAKAAACAACHGPSGIAVAPDAPNLAGQPAGYLVEQLRAYRSGTRKHEVMSLMAKPLTDADVDQLAAYFASQQIELKKP